MTRKRRARGVALACIVLAQALHAAAAAARSAALDRVSFALGAAYGYPRVQAGIGAFGESFRTPPFGLSDERTLLPRLRLDLVLGARHGLSFDYFELRSGRSIEASQSFQSEGVEYTTAARVSGKVDADVLTAAYRFWFGSGNTVLGLGGGAAFYRLELGITGRASLNGDAIEARAGYASDETAPVLSAGLRHAFSDRVRAYADVSGIRRTGGHLNGHLYTAGIGMEWYPSRNLGLGVEYGSKRIALERQGSADARLNLRLDKPTFFLRARF